jgi:hypothetical protein
MRSRDFIIEVDPKHFEDAVDHVTDGFMNICDVDHENNELIFDDKDNYLDMLYDFNELNIQCKAYSLGGN